jgi:hypothetical protein
VTGPRIFAAILLSCASISAASVPIYDPYFKPSTSTKSGPGSFDFSGFCIMLKPGETATREQRAPWANVTLAELSEGQLQIGETSSGYSSGIGKRFRKVKGGWIRKVRQEGNIVYYFDNGLPGSTTITFLSKRGGQKLNRVLGRFVFGATCQAATQ